MSGLKLQNLKISHIEGYAKDMLSRGLKPRTVQSEMSSLRGALRAAGCAKVADNLQNSKLGIAGASRAGRHRAMPDNRYQSLRQTLIERGHDGVAAVVELQRALGLRAKEAIMATESLKSWSQALAEGRPVHIIHGTKGGRARLVHIANVPRAQAAVANARAWASQHDGRIIDKPNLKSAMSYYHSTMHRAGAVGEYSGHALRYAFAADQVQHYTQHGLPPREALAASSLDLGHGDGRGKYVQRVYLRA